MWYLLVQVLCRLMQRDLTPSVAITHKLHVLTDYTFHSLVELAKSLHAQVNHMDVVRYQQQRGGMQRRPFSLRWNQEKQLRLKMCCTYEGVLVYRAPRKLRL